LRVDARTLSDSIYVMANVIQLARSSGLRGYLRPGRSTAGRLKTMIAAGRRPCDGVVLDAALWTRLSELADVAKSSDIETVLDPRSLELASAGGRSRGGIAGLPWAGTSIHDTGTLRSRHARADIIVPIAHFVAEHHLDAVLAPTHFFETLDDDWLAIDDMLTLELREALDSLGRADARLYRPLYLPSRLLAGRYATGAALVGRLGAYHHVEALWIAVHPFGASAGPVALRRYVDFCRSLHAAGLPLVGMRTGTVGILLMALGAVSAIESGVTDGETFDVEVLTRAPRTPRDGEKIIGATPRVYLQGLGAFVTTKEAEAFFAVRGMTSSHACQSACCPRGSRDMIERRIDHFALRRQAEIDALSRIPVHRRARDWLDTELRPASDRAIAAERVHPRLRSVRKRLDDWRRTTAGLLDIDDRTPPTVARAITSVRDRTAPRRTGSNV
jgi:hypothetical protein